LWCPFRENSHGVEGDCTCGNPETAAGLRTSFDVGPDCSPAVAALGLDKATVFRNLNDLTEAGLLSRSELGDHVWRFEIRTEKHSHGAAHPHFLCIDCGSVTCLPGSTIPTALKSSAESIGEITEILVRGHCHNCAT